MSYDFPAIRNMAGSEGVTWNERAMLRLFVSKH